MEMSRLRTDRQTDRQTCEYRARILWSVNRIRNFTVGYQGAPNEEAGQKIFLHISQVWKTPKWRRLVPEGVLHVNWDPFRPRRSHIQLFFYQNNLFIALLQRWGPRLHPQSKNKDIGVYLASILWRIQKNSIAVIMLVSRWQVPIPSASSPRPKEFPPVSGLASTFSPPTWQHLYSTWNSRQLLFYFYIFCKTVCSTASPVLLQHPRRRRPMSPFHLHSHSMDPGRESQNLLTFVFRRFWATWRKSLDLERAAWLSWVDLEENIPRFTSVQSSINVDIEILILRWFVCLD